MVKKRKGITVTLIRFLVFLVICQSYSCGEAMSSTPLFRQEELDQMLAPIALYPDALLAQILMAATYPMEIVQASRWVEANRGMQGDALAYALENEDWEPSVKSLVQFPDVLSMMNQNLQWTQKVGDAFLAQQEDVTYTIQNLRRKAYEYGNLTTTKEQVVRVEKEVVYIEPASPKTVYIPMYNPSVVYGSWWYPSYPPYYYYPPRYPPPPLYGFATAVAIGVAWGYAWGHWDWHHHHVKVDINRNVYINHRINRDRYVQHYGGKEGLWRHNVNHRKGVSYRDVTTAQKYNRAASREVVKAREAYRGRSPQQRNMEQSLQRQEQVKRNISRESPVQGKPNLPKVGQDKQITRDQPKDRPSQGKADIPKVGQDQKISRNMPKDRPAQGKAELSKSGQDKQISTGRVDRGGALKDMDRSGSSTREFSSRGSASRMGTSPASGGGFNRGGKDRGGRR